MLALHGLNVKSNRLSPSSLRMSFSLAVTFSRSLPTSKDANVHCTVRQQKFMDGQEPIRMDIRIKDSLRMLVLPCK